MSDQLLPLSAHTSKPLAVRSPQLGQAVVGPAQTPSSSPSAMAERTRRIVEIMLHRGQGTGADDPSPDSAEVAAAVIRLATRRGRRLSVLPASIRVQLDRLCDAGDPAGLLVRDWIECKLPKPIADALAETGDEATKEMV